MKSFEANGRWFPADDQSNSVSGVFRFSKEGLDLSLQGSFRESWVSGSSEYPIIHGALGPNPYGNYVTIFGGHRKSFSTNMPGITSEVITASRAMLGDDYVESETTEFDSITLELSYLDDWYGGTGFSSEDREGNEFDFSLIYKQPKPVKFPVNDGKLELCLRTSSERPGHAAKIEEKARIMIEPIGRLPWSSLTGRFVRPIQDLLSFATDTPNAVDDIEFRGDQDERFEIEYKKKCNLIYDAIFKLDKKNLPLPSRDMLFTFTDTQDAGLNIFRSWFEFTEKHENFCTVYFSSLYAPPRYLDEKFSRLLSAFTFLCSSLFMVPERTKFLLSEIDSAVAARFTVEERAMVGHAFPTAPEVEMPFHLVRLLDENATLMKQIVKCGFDDFVRSVSDTIGFVHRRKVLDQRPVLERGSLYSAMQQIRILIKIVILKELGFDHDRVVAIVERNNDFNHLKAL